MLQLQCVAVCCSVLQCVAAFYSVLQRVAVFCSVLQCVEKEIPDVLASSMLHVTRNMTGVRIVSTL